MNVIKDTKAEIALHQKALSANGIPVNAASHGLWQRHNNEL